ncbi:MAG: enoyl-CoA hydratase-related protein [Alphaproteobacteria bacterium]|jgi:enoyl-CoA hydratase/carnithine racemase|nr:enoyl-CoA hydratase-related protein [Alphaproteobacteria bacterium]
MSTVLFEKRGKIATVTINRPEVMNCIDPDTHRLLWETWAEFDADDEVELAILTGAGDEAFCAGADLKHYIPPLLTADALYPRQKVADGFGGITRGQHRILKPIIAAVNGWALAGGFELAMACDIRIASDQAQFGSFEVRRGYHHGDGGVARLVNICGTGFALEMLLTGEPIDAERAQQVNMVSRVVPHGELMASADEMASKILRNDTWAIRSAKETVFEMIGRGLEDQLMMDCIYGYTGVANPPVMERLQAFYDKRDRGRVGKHATET